MIIRSIITRNPGLKLVSLFLALLLELYFYSPVYYVDGEMVVGVELTGIPSSSIVVSPLGYEKGLFVKVQVRGPGPLVEQVKSGERRFRLRFRAEDGMKPKYTLNPTELNIPSGLQVVAMSPNVFEFQIEPLIQKELLVEPRVIGRTKEGFQVQALRSFPTTVLVQGPKTELDSAAHIFTESIDVSGLLNSKRLDVELEPVGRLARMAVATVSVEVEIQKVQQEREFKDIGVEVLGPPGMAASADLTRAEIIVSGTDQRLKEVTPASLQLQADARSLGVGKHRIELSGKLPNDVYFVRALPESVTVTVVSGTPTKPKPSSRAKS